MTEKRQSIYHNHYLSSLIHPNPDSTACTFSFISFECSNVMIMILVHFSAASLSCMCRHLLTAGNAALVLIAGGSSHHLFITTLCPVLPLVSHCKYNAVYQILKSYSRVELSENSDVVIEKSTNITMRLRFVLVAHYLVLSQSGFSVLQIRVTLHSLRALFLLLFQSALP